MTIAINVKGYVNNNSRGGGDLSYQLKTTEELRVMSGDELFTELQKADVEYFNLINSKDFCPNKDGIGFNDVDYVVLIDSSYVTISNGEYVYFNTSANERKTYSGSAPKSPKHICTK